MTLQRIALSYIRVVRSPGYSKLWLAQLTSSLGDTVHYIALVVLVFQMTGSGLAVSAMVAAEVIPILLLGPVAGVIIDRFSRQSVLIGSDLFRAALVLSLVWPQNLAHVYLVAAALAAGNTFFNPTVQAVIPAITTEAQRVAANSVAWSTGRLVQIIGSAVVGGLVAWVGTGPAFVFNAATFVVSAALIAAMDIPTHAGVVAAGARRGLSGYGRDIGAGLRYARRDPFMSRLVPVQMLASLATGATSALLVVLSERHLRLSPAGFAWLIGAIGVGALLGPVVLGILTTDPRDVRFLFIPYVIRGVGDILIATFTPLWAALSILVIYGLNTSSGMVTFNTTIQSNVADEYRGRAFTLLDITWNAMRLISLGLGGLLVDVVGVQSVYYLGGALLVATGLLGLRTMRGLDLRQPAA